MSLILLLKGLAYVLKLITFSSLILIILGCFLDYIKIGIFSTIIVPLYIIGTLTLLLPFYILAIIKINIIIREVL